MAQTKWILCPQMEVDIAALGETISVADATRLGAEIYGESYDV